MEYVKQVKLNHGLIEGKEGLESAAPLVASYTHELLRPLKDGTEKIVIQCNTLREVLESNNRIAKRYVPGTEEFRRAIIADNFAKRCSPALSESDIDGLAGTDFDDLVYIINFGRHPETQKEIFEIKEEGERTQGAFIRLHDRRDRDFAEQRLELGKQSEPILYEIQLAYLLVSFNESPSFTKAERLPFETFLGITWSDFQKLTSAVYMRDYKPLSEILEGTVTGEGGAKIPFQDSAETEVGAHN